MNIELVAAAFLLAFIPTWLFMPRFIRRLKRKKHLLREDKNKLGKTRVPSFGGIALVMWFMFSVASIILLSAMLGLNSLSLEILLPSLLSITLIALLGLVDDLLEIPRRFVKPIICLYASIPLMATTALVSAVYVPFFGEIEIGVMYYLLFIPLAIIFYSNAVNILSTYNGLEAGASIIVAAGFFIIALFKGETIGAIMSAALLGTLLAFYHFNKYPSKIFLGNVGTLAIGAVLAIIGIAGNMQKALVIMMVPYFVHFLFYGRNLFRWKPEMWGKPRKDGLLECPYDRPYGLMHWLLCRNPRSEKEVVRNIMAIELVFVALAVFLEGLRFVL